MCTTADSTRIRMKKKKDERPKEFVRAPELELRPGESREPIRLFCCGRNVEPERLNPEPENGRERIGGQDRRDGALP
jgi:hypothetical protein